MAQCDTCDKEILRADGHYVSGPEAASIMRPHYEKLAKGLGHGQDYVEACLAMARQGGQNLVCDECFTKIDEKRKLSKQRKEARINQQQAEQQKQTEEWGGCCRMCGAKLSPRENFIGGGLCEQHRNAAKLHDPAERGDASKVAQLLKAGADVNAKNVDYGATLLIVASTVGHAAVTDIPKPLLEWLEKAYSDIMWGGVYERLPDIVTLGSTAVDHLVYALETRQHRHRERTPQTRALIMHALGEIGDRRAVAVIRRQLNSADGGPKVWGVAALALAKLGDPAAIPDLKRAFDEGKAPEAVTKALEALGTDATPRDLLSLPPIQDMESLVEKYDNFASPKSTQLRAALRDLRIEPGGHAYAALQSQISGIRELSPEKAEMCQIRHGDLETTLGALMSCIITDQAFSIYPERRGLKGPFTVSGLLTPSSYSG